MHHPWMKLFAALATGLGAVWSAWEGVAGWWRGTVLVFKRGDETWVAHADNAALFWYCVVGWFVLCAMFAYLCRRWWREFGEA